MYNRFIVIAIAVLISLYTSVCGDVIEQAPQSLFLPVASDGNFVCKVNLSVNLTGISWIISTRELTLNYPANDMLLNSYGFTVISSSSYLSVLSVEGVIANNGTGVRCSVTLGSQLTPVQSPEVKLTLYGPPDAVNISTVTPLLHAVRLLWTPVQPMFNNEGDKIPFNYTINIKSAGRNLVESISQNESEYLFEVGKNESCVEYNFTLQTVNDAGYSIESTIITLKIPDVPPRITNISSEVFFNSNGDPQLKINFLQNFTCCDYPALNYTLNLVDQYSNVTLLTVPNSSMALCDSHVTLSTISNEVLPDRRYSISLVASNQVGTSERSDSVEIITTSLRQLRAILIGNQLTISCHFANGSRSTGCSLQIFLLMTNNTELTPLTNITTFERNPPNALMATGVLSLDQEYTPSLLVVIATDYDSIEEMAGDVTIRATPTWETIATTSTTSTLTSVSMTTSSTVEATTTSTIALPTVSVTIGGISPKPISQTTVAIIVGIGAGTLTLLAVMVIVTGVLIRSCTRKRKGKTFIVDYGGEKTTEGSDQIKSNGGENGYVKNHHQSSPTSRKTDTLQSGITIRSEDVQTDFKNIVGPDLDNLITPYGITTLVQPDPTIPEPVYQELPDRPTFFTQSSTTPLLETSITPPPIAPRERHLQQPSKTIPVYHVLEESAGSLSSNEIIPVLYDEVPVFQGTEEVDGEGGGHVSLSSGESSAPVPTSSSPLLSTTPPVLSTTPPSPPLSTNNTPPSSSPFGSPSSLPPPLFSVAPHSSNSPPHRQGKVGGVRKHSLTNGSSPNGLQNGMTDYPKRQAISNLERLNHNVMIVESQQKGGEGEGEREGSYPPSPTRSYMYATPTKGRFPPPTVRQFSCQNSFSVTPNGEMKKSVSVPAAMRQRCNSTGGNEDSVYDKLEKERSNFTWTLKRTLV